MSDSMANVVSEDTFLPRIHFSSAVQYTKLILWQRQEGLMMEMVISQYDVT